MARWAIVISGLVLAMGTRAQADTAGTGRPPWLEVMYGLNTPAGMLGFGFGLPCGPHFTPAVAVGYGTPEGAHLSAGMEYHILQTGMAHWGAFGYWTYTPGYGNNNDGRDKHCTPGQMLEGGASVVLHAAEMEFSFRAGYSGYIVTPVSHAAWGGFANPGPGATTLEGGVVLSMGLRFALGK